MDENQSNNMVAAGAIAGALMRAGVKIENMPQLLSGNSCDITVRFEFMKSAYRITVSRIEGTEIETGKPT